MGIVHKNTANDLRETWRRPFPNTNCWNQKSLHSFRNRERLWSTNCVRLQQTARESERLYDFVVVASQLLRRGATFGALKAFQPCAGEQEDQKAQPSDGHILLKPPDLKATGPLPEEDASVKDKSIGCTNRAQVTCLTWKDGITWSGTGSGRTGVPIGEGDETVFTVSNLLSETTPQVQRSLIFSMAASWEIHPSWRRRVETLLLRKLSSYLWQTPATQGA